jgi:hypothetical protein
VLSSDADFEQPAKTKLATANAATTLSFFEICIISLSDIVSFLELDPRDKRFDGVSMPAVARFRHPE